jgi:hypothetical protein
LAGGREPAAGKKEEKGVRGRIMILALMLFSVFRYNYYYTSGIYILLQEGFWGCNLYIYPYHLFLMIIYLLR